MADALETHSIPNLIQGVSQQVEQQRRDTQAEAQFDCINDPVSGCRARPSAELVKFLPGVNFAGAAVFDIARSVDEHYLVVVLNGDLKVYDMADGTECSVTFADGKAYLATTGLPVDQIRTTIVDDHSFVVNRGIKPAMAAALSTSRPKEAIAYFKAGAYSMEFTLAITYAGTTYTWTYKTPDNSTSGNADYIATDQLAKTFYNGLTLGTGPTLSAHATKSAWWSAGSTGTTSTSAVTATSLGFSVGIVGSTLHIWRTDGNDFEITATDGAGDTYFVTIKDTVRSFSTLPNKGIIDFVTKVKGSDASKDDDYWVKYLSDGGGYWEETVQPAIKTSLDASTMPWDLYNTDYRAFTFKKSPWGARLVGDEDSAPDPSFVGKSIQDLFSDHARLGILTEAGAVWSKSRNPYSFFRDSAQTLLATDPIDYSVMGGKQISLFRHAVLVDEGLFLWSQKGQWRITSGTDPFKQDTVDAKRAASYEFAEACAPLEVGKSLYFATESGSWTALRDLTVADGKIRGDTNVTRHVPRYIPASIRRLSGSDTLECLVAFCEDTPQRLYLYNWVMGDNYQRVQSAWNILRLPPWCSIVWHGFYESKLLILVQMADGAAILSMDFTSDLTDPGEDWHQRMDLRTGSSSLTVTYDAATNRSTVTCPFPWGDGADPVVSVRTSKADGYYRGYSFPVEGTSGHAVTVKGDLRGYDLWVGQRITSERTESRFFKRDQNGTAPVDTLTVHEVEYAHARTGYYRAEVTQDNGRAYRYEFEARRLGSPTNLLDATALDTGSLKIPVGAEAGSYSLRLVNDTHLPSAWQSAAVRFKSTSRALPPTQGR